MHDTSSWTYVPLILTVFISIVLGGIGSEYVQSMLPVRTCYSYNQYKTFQLGDVIANLLGGSIGLYASYQLERQCRDDEARQLYEPLDLENPSESLGI